MKKIISILLVFIICLLCVACNSQEQQGEGTSKREQETEKVTEQKIYDNTPYPYLFREWFDWPYIELESFSPNVNDIVKATYVGAVKKSPDYYLYDFEVKEVIKGTCKKELITVWATAVEYSFGWYDDKIPVLGYDTLAINYEVGKDYLLLLTRSPNEYMEKDGLRSVDDSLIIPLNENGTIDLENCKLYNTDLMLHIRDSETEEALKNGIFVERLLELTKDNPPVDLEIDTPYKDPGTTMNEADYVWIIKVEKDLEDPILPYYVAQYGCNIINKLKGDHSSDTVTIHLPTEKVEVGKTYVVALDSDHYLSSRYSLFEYSVDYSTKKTDMITLCTEAAYVYVVEVDEKQFAWRDCRIISSLKGEYENEKIYLFVHEDDFEVGKKYVVALDKDKKLIGMTEIPPTTQ